MKQVPPGYYEKKHDAKPFRKQNAHRSGFPPCNQACTYTENLGRGFPMMRSLTL